MTKKFRIGTSLIGPGEPVFVIAEIGINHDGSAERCAQMIHEAAGAGANAVKLQTVDADASYVAGTVSHAVFKENSLDEPALAELVRIANGLGLALISTPGDFESLDRIVCAGTQAIKVSSGLMTNLPLVRRAASARLPLIISTGLAYEAEIDLVLQTAIDSGASDVSLLKCTALYPSLDDSVNLAAIGAMIARYPVPIGYSDHTLDGLACVGAVACGATIIEKHFTLDRTAPGADHHISMEPAPFAMMVNEIRRMGEMRGNGQIRPVPAEIAVRSERHRCLVARVDIAVGERFTEENVALKRPLPGTAGLPATAYASVLGKTALEAVERDRPIAPSHVGALE